MCPYHNKGPPPKDDHPQAESCRWVCSVLGKANHSCLRSTKRIPGLWVQESNNKHSKKKKSWFKALAPLHAHPPPKSLFKKMMIYFFNVLSLWGSRHKLMSIQRSTDLQPGLQNSVRQVSRVVSSTSLNNSNRHCPMIRLWKAISSKSTSPRQLGPTANSSSLDRK